MKKVIYGQAEKRVALCFGTQKINLHQLGNEFEPKASNAQPGTADLCFIVTETIDEIVRHLQANNIPLISGPISRTGAVGNMSSVYFRDPDSNLIELSNYNE